MFTSLNLLKPSKITRKFSLILGGLLTSSLLFALPVTAQITDAKVDSLVEALRLAAPDMGMENDGLYSDWQIKPDNIPRWSRLCIQQELTPEEFAANEAQAREVLACVMSDVFQEEYEAIYSVSHLHKVLPSPQTPLHPP
jgi:hypothetical protein